MDIEQQANEFADYIIDATNDNDHQCSVIASIIGNLAQYLADYID